MINFQIIILGKSGAKFYASYDELYVIKTLTSEEIEQMHSLLKQYHPFVVERHGKLISLSNAGIRAQSVELKLRLRFCVHTSTCPEIYSQSKF